MLEGENLWKDHKTSKVSGVFLEFSCKIEFFISGVFEQLYLFFIIMQIFRKLPQISGPRPIVNPPQNGHSNI